MCKAATTRKNYIESMQIDEAARQQKIMQIISQGVVK